MNQIDRSIGKIDGSLQSSEEPLRILLAEDQVINQKICQRILNTMGHVVSVANDGAEAIELWGAGDFDLILMDVQMPGVDGIEATQSIREAEHRQGRARTAIIAITAHSFQGYGESLLTQGFDGYVSKPIDISLLKVEFLRVLARANYTLSDLP